MNILLINPPNNPYTEKSLLIEPIDILNLAAYLNDLGHDIAFLDMDLKQMKMEALKEYIQKQHHINAVVISYDYHIPLHTTKTIDNIKEMCDLLKPFGIKTVLIGKTISYSNRFAKLVDFDIGVVGEAELALKELFALAHWNEDSLSTVKGIIYKTNGEIKKTSSRKTKIDLDTLPLINRSLVDIHEYMDVRSILTSRGCLNNCDFCPTYNFWGKWRGKSALKVVEEIEEVVSAYQSQKIIFLDDNMTVDNNRMKEISNLIIEKNLDMKFGCLSSINSFDEEMFLLMYQAGFRWVHFGIETGSQRVLNCNNKYFDLDYAKEVILKVKQMGYRVRTSFIFDLPKTEKEDMQKTIDFILETQPNEIRGHFLALRLGTKIYEQSEKKGKLTSQYIHRNAPELESKHYSNEALIHDIKYLAEELKQRGYAIIDDVSKWKDIEQLRNAEGNVNFLSFCPSKYGIDWEKM